MEVMSAKEAAAEWNITQRRVIVLCSEGRIAGAQIVGNSWVIPRDAKKPLDARIKDVKGEASCAKPFLKWAGGKGQLLHEIEKLYPFKNDLSIKKYAEPFVGGGAVLFDVLNRFNLEEVYISDINAELINSYIIIRDDVDSLIERLKLIEKQFNNNGLEGRKDEYLRFRALFNDKKRSQQHDVEMAALMIFLNKTCFNGLYRVNRHGDFNVPMGAYKNPLICNENNLREVSRKLQGIRIVCGDYKDSADFVDNRTFIYLDPPYRPITKTANFTSYTEQLFDDGKQLELARFVQDLDNKGALVAISNSDPKNTDENDNFFDDVYAKQNIRRVAATRMINRNSSSRGKINELLISNF